VGDQHVESAVVGQGIGLWRGMPIGTHGERKGERPQKQEQDCPREGVVAAVAHQGNGNEADGEPPGG
jgi:hypothetical protein